MKLILAIFFIALLASVCLCASSISISGQISSTGNDRISITMDVPANQTIKCIWPGQIYSINIYGSDGQKLNPDVRFENGSSIIKMLIPGGHAQGEIVTDYLTSKTGNRWIFNSTSIFSIPINSFDARVKLPPGAMIVRTNGMVQDEFWGSSILWHVDNLSSMAPVGRSVVYELKDEPGYNTFLLVACLALAIALVWLFLKFRKVLQEKRAMGRKPAGKHQQAEKQDFESSPAFKTLEETDKDILREIRMQGGKTTQAHLYANTHIKKATLSRHMASLESRGLIKRTQKGIKKIVSLEPAAFGPKS